MARTLPTPLWATSAVLALAVATTSCSSSKAVDSDATQGGSVPGVSADEIRLGVIADLTGPFASTGVPTVEGAQVFWQDRTVCDRRVKLVVKDTSYKTDRAKVAYSELREDVLAIQATTATPITVVNMDGFTADKMLVLAVASPALAGHDNILLAGTLNDVEMMNAVSYAVRDLGVRKGDTVGVIYLDNDFGRGSLEGVRKAASMAGLTLVEQPANPTDTDMTAQVTALKAQHVTAVFVAGSAAVLNSAVTVAKGQGMNVPFVSSAGAFDASALGTSAKAGLVDNTYLVAYVAPFTSNAPGPTAVRTGVEASAAKEAPSHWLNLGYGMASIMEKTLAASCDTLTRDGLLAAAQGLGEVDTGGALVPLDFAKRSPGVASYVLRPDASVPGGLRVHREPSVGDLTQKFLDSPQ